MIIIAGTIDLADPAKRDEAIERAKPLQQATRDEEPGCHAYVFSADPCVPGRIAVYELWEDETPLRVGALIPYSGRWGDSGRECARGMMDGARWLNQREGILGRKLEIILIDDTSQPAETIAAYRKFN